MTPNGNDAARSRHFLIVDLERRTDLAVEASPAGDGRWRLTVRDRASDRVIQEFTEDLSRLPLLRSLLRRAPRPPRIA